MRPFTRLPANIESPTPLPRQIDNRGATLLFVPADYFIMGIDPAVLGEECALFGRQCDGALLEPSAPQHPVYVNAFYIDATEVTNAAYALFLNEIGDERGCEGHACLVPGSRVQRQGNVYQVDVDFAEHPVHSVTWYGAAVYCRWRGGRLPTEAEWEMAASWQADGNSKSLYPWGNVFEGGLTNSCDASCNQAQANGAYDDGYAETAPVTSFPMGSSPIGAYDMGGNVWEWAADWFNPRYYAFSPEQNPQGPSEGQGRALRGGSWFDSGVFTATVFRTGLAPHESNDSIGFRCAQTVDT